MTDESDEPNRILAVDDLPTPDTPCFEPLARSYIAALRLTWFIVVAAVISVNSAISFASGDGIARFTSPTILPIASAVLLLLVVAAIMVPRVLWQSQGYQLRERDLHYRHGVIWRAVTSLPYGRIQHVELESGPLERFFKMATLKFYTAGGGSADMKIPGLPFATASKIRGHVMEKAGVNTNGEAMHEASDG